ncbi:uncharacterized protein FOMMEDRAFT_32255 [Fomitiporia mediterranea MF3/22]|uniref:uncharacterized protein n=1 Tax=Fomitiporia mediterranea (strain MF3/22) TaxID=694068 RepID=UPI000440974B|nr:uncharacterized protein FOMMEDRAFT_32255 [Fomitiporia mediterranea MF3/22]EJC98059.1 hypothetical protein FOMMEDRAFT_32255 [Fomitiporia mediterranea MF3/22]
MSRTHSPRDQWQTSSTKKKMYEQPEGFIAKTLWRLWMKTKATFAFSMLEAWEIILIFVITGIVTVLVTIALVRYLPYTILSASRRAHYYLSGQDSVVDWSNLLSFEMWNGSRIEM